MKFKRMLAHLMMPGWRVRRLFTTSVMTHIEKVIQEGEANHHGELRFAVEASLHPLAIWRDETARERAIEVFSQLQVWDTANNNGVLIYLLLADHDVEIVVDRDLNHRVDHQQWEQICHDMEADFRAGRFEKGVIAGIKSINNILSRHYPNSGPDQNELPDKPVML